MCLWSNTASQYTTATTIHIGNRFSRDLLYLAHMFVNITLVAFVFYIILSNHTVILHPIKQSPLRHYKDHQLQKILSISLAG